ncbi:hypothetical protein ACQZV8_19645 [Magnetococcales bacterium HHB-1]
MNSYTTRSIFLIASFIVLMIILSATLSDGILKDLSPFALMTILLGFLLNLQRDSINQQYKQDLHEVQQEFNVRLQRMQHTFSLGATSHMSNVAFDKHTAFCEEYMDEIDKMVVTLLRNGPCEEALSHAGNLYGIRDKHSAWIPEDIANQLEPLEQTLRDIGAKQGYLNATINETNGARDAARSKNIGEVYRDFRELLRLQDSEGEFDESKSKEAYKKKIRSILGIEDLFVIRKALIKDARDQVDSKQIDLEGHV